MPRLQYTPYTKSSGYKPQQVDQSNLARMREEAQRTLNGMQRYAEADIQNRKEVLAQEKEDQAYQKQAQARNFEIQTQNAQNQLKGILGEGERIQQQYNADLKARQDFYKGLTQFSRIAGGIVKDLQEKKEKEDFDNEVNKGADPQNIIKQRIDEHRLASLDLAQVTALQEAFTKGEDPYVISKLGAEADGQAYFATKGAIASYAKYQYAGDHADYINNIETQLGRKLTHDEAIFYTAAFRRTINQSVRDKDLSHKLLAPALRYLDEHDAAFFSSVRKRQTKENNQIILNQALKILTDIDSDDLNTVWPAQWQRIVNSQDGDKTKAWELVTNSVFLARDEKTGKFYRSLDEIGNLTLYTDDAKDGITFKDKFERSRWQDLQRERNRLDLQHRKQLQQIDDLNFVEESDKLFQALGPNYTEDQVEEAQNTLWTKYGKVDPRFNTHAKKFTIESRLRAAEAARIEALPDYELNDGVLAAYKEVAPPDKYNILQQRRASYDGKWRSKDAEEAVKRGLNVITGTTAFGTSKAAQPGAAPALRYFEAQALKNAKVMEGAMGGAIPALEKAVADESSRYLSSYREPTSVYYRKVEKDGSVSYPNLPGAQNISAADAALRDISNMRVKVKEAGNAEAALRIPNLVMSDARMEQVAQNYGKPGFLPNAKEMAFKGMTNGMPLHEVYNQAFAAAGRKERFASPLQNVGIQVPPHLQKVLNDPAASRVSKMNAVNVASGNTEIYSRPSAVRAGSPLKRSFTGALTYADNKQAYKAAGNAIQNVGFTVTEHPDFGGVAPGVHSANSYHGYGEAMDIILKRGTRAEDIQNTARLKTLIRSMNLFEEVIGPGDGDPNHETHLHVGGLKRPITPQDIATLKSFWGR